MGRDVNLISAGCVLYMRVYKPDDPARFTWYFCVFSFRVGGTRWRSWLRHCATSRKVAGSIPDGVIGFFHLHNFSGRAMALGSTQPLTEMSTRNVSWGLRRPVRRADNLTSFMCRLSCNLGASTSWNPQGLSRPVMGLLFTFRMGKSRHVKSCCL